VLGEVADASPDRIIPLHLYCYYQYLTGRAITETNCDIPSESEVVDVIME
jgi:hypothetical protein